MRSVAGGCLPLRSRFLPVGCATARARACELHAAQRGGSRLHARREWLSSLRTSACDCLVGLCTGERRAVVPGLARARWRWGERARRASVPAATCVYTARKRTPLADSSRRGRVRTRSVDSWRASLRIVKTEPARWSTAFCESEARIPLERCATHCRARIGARLGVVPAMRARRAPTRAAELGTV
jgi:hypothetical protein